MISEVSIIIFPEQEENKKIILEKILCELEKKNIRANADEIKYTVLKKSIDARRKKIKLIMRYKIFIGESPENTLKMPEWKKSDGKKSVVIIGSGPAGLFGALKLLEFGIKPVIIERGSDASQRKRDIAAISTKEIVDENSNYCFGEGGAGTFSDGKLYTRSNKRGNISSILKIFNYFGADQKILTDAHPHIGTDKLPFIISNIRKFIIEQGGEFHFNTKCIDFITEEKSAQKILSGIKTKNTKSGEEKIFTADAFLLATGHSASDIYKTIAKRSAQILQAKTFAVGVRVEHPREVIDRLQYHGNAQNLGAAEYRFTSQQEGRGVYSFCMCPGGFIVPSSTGSQEIVVNGMSAAGRNSKWSNAAIVVETRPEDIPQEFVEKAENYGTKELAGLLWRENLERETFLHGQNQKAPSQRLVDFLKKRESLTLPQSSYTPGLVPSRLDLWLPDHIKTRLSLGFKTFDRERKGYIDENAIMIAIESRTSTPVRILRNENGECDCLKNLYPSGEGAGYAGGIVSSAMDGENQCTKIAEKILSC